jgi:hypothetical protein
MYRNPRRKDYTPHIVASVLVGFLLILYWLWKMPAPSSNGNPKHSITENRLSGETDLEIVLAEGDGHDWLNLSDRQRVQLCKLASKKTGRHTPSIFLEFLGNYYRKAEEESPSLLSQPISEVAAVAAGLNLRE